MKPAFFFLGIKKTSCPVCCHWKDGWSGKWFKMPGFLKQFYLGYHVPQSEYSNWGYIYIIW